MLSVSVPTDLTPCPMELRHFLRYRAGISLSHWRKIKNKGSLFINDHPAHPCDAVIPGDIITIQMPVSTALSLSPIPINCFYEDEWLLVVDKPAGLLMHPTASERSDTLANRILFHYQITNQSLDFHPVHRLDRQTSGLVLIAKSPHIQHAFTRNTLQLQRQYLAIIHGIPSPLHGKIDFPIARSANSIITREVNVAGQTAITEYETISYSQEHSLQKIKLHTGRTHQIRVHFSHLGHSLLGDSLYGAASKLISRQALHSHSLSFRHPITHRQETFVSLPPADMRKALTLLSLALPE